jgi:predicted transcriptional regulator
VPASRAPSKLSPEEAAIALRFRQACGRHSFRTLAKAAGVSHESIRRYYTGRCMVPLLVVAKVCKFVNVPTEWVVDGERPKSQ